MDIKTLRDRMGSGLFGSDADLVRIRLDQPSVGPVAMMDIGEAYAGFDWEDGSFILLPEKALVSWEYLEKYHPGIRDEIERDRKRYASRPIRCIFAGSRDFGEAPEHRKLIEKQLRNLVIVPYTDASKIEIVSGCARGVDSVAAEIARDLGYAVKEFPADWETYGKAAGHIRNKQMADYVSEDDFNYHGRLVAFWDGKSSGTKNMIDTATKMGIETFTLNVANMMDGADDAEK